MQWLCGKKTSRKLLKPKNTLSQKNQMKQLSNIIIAALLLFIIFRDFGCSGGSGSGNVGKPDTTVVHDTTWQRYDSIVYKKVKVIETIHEPTPPEYLPNPMYDSLKVQYEELAKAYLAKNIYKDTFRIPQIKGLIIVNDTVKNNQLMGRSWTADYMIPTVKETITIVKPCIPKRQLYVGGGFSANMTGFGNAQVGLLYKDRKDRIYGGFVSVQPTGSITYGVQSYWKIRLKK